MVFVYEAGQREHNPSLCAPGDRITLLPPPASCFLILLRIFVPSLPLHVSIQP